jgi:signal transduction histidine kinase
MSLTRRILCAGIAVALAVLAGGWMLERMRLGASDEAASARVEAELRQRFNASADVLGAVASRVLPHTDTIRAASRDTAAAKQLFEQVDDALPDDEAGRTGITVYDVAGAPLAWSGRVSEPPKTRISGPAALFVAPGALGPRLVRVEPVPEPGRPAAPRLATIVVEQSLGSVEAPPSLADTFTLSTSIATVTLRSRSGGVQTRGPFSFTIPSRGGGALVDADVSQADLAGARASWRLDVWAAVESVLALTLLLCAVPLIEFRRNTRRPKTFLTATAGIALLIIAARFVLWMALTPIMGPRVAIAPPDLLLSALALMALVWLTIDLIERRRYTRPRPRLIGPGRGVRAIAALAFAAAGAADVWLLWMYERTLQWVVLRTPLDLLHFSLHPLNLTRLGLAFGLVLLHAAMIWAAAAVIRTPSLVRRIPRGFAVRLGVPAWLSGVALALLAIRPAPRVPLGPLMLTLGAAAICALGLAAMRARARRASQAARLGALFLAFLVPAVAVYPSLFAFATAAKERLIATDYGPQAASQREDLQERLREALDTIDAMPALRSLIADAPAEAPPTTDRAFAVWSRTDLAAYRLPSAVELYSPSGSLVSRFALNLPETGPLHHATSCTNWDFFDEVSPFGSSERHVLRASRGLCDDRRRSLGSIVVRAMLDQEALPFISSQSPYLESLQPYKQATAEGLSGRDVEFVVYGWSRAPIYASGTSTWPLPDAVFDRLVASRTPFWATLTRDHRRFRVYLLSDRGGIYALGYPVITGFGHLINLAELITLVFAVFVMLLALATLVSVLTSRTPASGRALLREIRRSFYSKLFLAYLAGSVVPVVTLAIATRAYFASQFRAGVEEAAAKSATVAQRLVEDYASLQQRGTGGAASALGVLDDQIMLLVRRALDQDVNLFDRTQLQATSERDLFELRLLSTRTPGDVYQRIVLDRLPTYVGIEQVGDFQYYLAAAPVHAGGRERIVTVPATLRQQDIEQQIDDLDRRVLFGAVLFILLGGALGYWMAERIADPVNRLTRATRRIARGDLDARIAATSSDELRRLVEDFNQMAADLKRQRSELERTQRLEAWADMARQVAHDIKNPLTPIQLSAEHARRVNIDRGRPLSPILDECVTAILSQVTLLRQISAEFSSFASSPVCRPEPTRLPELIEEVIEPYRTGLTGRITIETDAPPNLPLVTIDRTLFARALTNVVENALHAMPGRGRLRIETRAEGGHTGPPLQQNEAAPAESRDVAAGADRRGDSVPSRAERHVSPAPAGADLRVSPAPAGADLRVSPAPAGDDQRVGPVSVGADLRVGPVSVGADLRVGPVSVGADLRVGPVVVVQITDTGVGMDAESIAKIFQPYFSTKATGTGLGLTIAKRNIELNGGTIHVTSERGVGTTVTLTLPLARNGSATG